MIDWKALLGHRVIVEVERSDGVTDLEERCVVEISPQGYIGFQYLPVLQRNVTVWRTPDFYKLIEDLGAINK